MRTRKITAEVVLRVFTRTTMTPRPRAVTPILFAVGLCAVTFHVNCVFAQYRPTCGGMDDMIDRSSLLDCTRNDLCDTADCIIDNPFIGHYTLTLTLLSCRNPPAVHMVLGDGDSTVFEADVDHTTNDIDISGVGDLDITLNQLEDQNAIGLGITVTVDLIFTSTIDVVPYSVLPLDTPSCTPAPTEPPIATEGNTTENITTDSPTIAGEGPYGPTCDGFDDLVSNVNHMVCTRNEDCDTADCDITQSPFDDYTLSMMLLSCREPRPGVRVVVRDGGGQVVLNTTVDESQSGIELSSEVDLDITLDQMEDSIGLAAEVDVDLGFFSTTLTLISYTILPLDRRSCPTQEPPITTESPPNITTTSSTATSTTEDTTTENITTTSSTATPTTEDTTTTDSATTDGPTIVDPTTEGEGPYGPTCDGFDDLVSNVNHMVCTRNEDCDTADCDITQSPFDDYTLSMTLLSCREPQPGVRVVARDGGGQEVLNAIVDESQSGIELSSEADLDITLDQMEDSIGLAADVDVHLGFFSTTLTLISYTILPLDRRSCPTQEPPITTESPPNITTTSSTATPTTEDTTTENITTTNSTATPTTEDTTTENITTTSSTEDTNTENITTTSSTATPTTEDTTTTDSATTEDTTTENITTTSSTATPTTEDTTTTDSATTEDTTTENITTTSSTATPATEDTTTTDSATSDGPTIVDPITEGEGPYGPTCDGFDDLINDVNHMVCTRNEDCDTADCDITQSPFDDYTLSMTLLSCREPRPGVRVVARDGGGQEVLNTTVDESQSGIELSSEADLDITLDQMEDSIGIAADVDVDFDFFSTTITLISYTILPLDRQSCSTQGITASPTFELPTTENTTTESPVTEDTTMEDSITTEPTVTPTSVITGVPSTQGVTTPTPQPTPTQDTTCSVLTKLADDAEFFKCTADKTEPCDTVFCSQEFAGKQYSAVVVLLPCETPTAVRIVMSEGEKVLVNETVDHSKEITIPELLGLVLIVTLDHFDDAIGLQADGMVASKTFTIIEYTVIPLDKSESTCVMKEQSHSEVLETTPTITSLLFPLITFLTAAMMM